MYDAKHLHFSLILITTEPREGHTLLQRIHARASVRSSFYTHTYTCRQVVTHHPQHPRGIGLQLQRAESSKRGCRYHPSYQSQNKPIRGTREDRRARAIKGRKRPVTQKRKVRKRRKLAKRMQDSVETSQHTHSKRKNRRATEG